MYNIFQGGDIINDSIKKSLKMGYPESVQLECKKFYFQAFFYLTKRFGAPEIFDNDKHAGVWIFKVKSYKIQIILNSSFPIFIIYGSYKFEKYRRKIDFNSDYRNSEINHAIKTFEQFLTNMLSPIWIRDESFNIQGQCISSYQRFSNNILIEREYLKK